MMVSNFNYCSMLCINPLFIYWQKDVILLIKVFKNRVDPQLPMVFIEKTIILCFYSFLLVEYSLVYGDEHERKLYDTLLQNYNSLERPVENNSFPVVVYLGLFLQQIIDLDEKNQILQTNVWLNYTWFDYNMIWDPEKYGGVTDLRFPANKVWKPDILLYNSVDSNFDSTYPANVVVYHTGTMVWVPPGILRSSCTINIRWFPFDDQVCYLKFGSWTFTMDKIHLKPHDAGVDIETYIESGEWLLTDKPVDYKETPFMGVTYVDLKFYLHLRRRTLYYGINMIIPSILISLMTLLGFALPVESGEKVTLEITILLSICVFLSMVGQMTPATSEAVPLIGAFFTCNMLVVSASVVLCVVVLNFHYRTLDTHLMPDSMRKILLHWLPWMLGMKRPGHKFTRKELKKLFQPKTKSSETESLVQDPLVIPDNNSNDKLGLLVQYQQLLECFVKTSAKLTAEEANSNMQILRLQQIFWELKFITQRMKRDDDEQEAKNDWKFAAMVIDRLCLYVFSIFIVLSTCGILFSAPHLIA